MRGIIGAGAYLPYWRLERSAIGAFHGGRGSGTRSVASYDQDTTTLGVEASRVALRSVGGQASVDTIWFSTSSPTYLEKTNATILHAALRMPSATSAFDMGGAVRSGVGVLTAAMRSGGTAALAVTADIRVGLPNSPDESAGGDGAAAFVVGEGDGVIAEYLGHGSNTAEFLDRWRAPGEVRTRIWEERFSQMRYADAAVEAVGAALADCGLDVGDVDRLVVASQSARAVAAAIKKIGVDPAALVSDRASSVGSCGCAELGIGLVAALEDAAPGQVIVGLSMADGADAVVLRTTEAIGAWTSPVPVSEQIDGGNPTLPYAKFLSWRGILELNPPNRPEPARMSGSAAGRSADWKYGFVASRDRSVRRGSHAARAGELRRRRRRRDGSSPDVRRQGDRGDVHDRPPRLFAEPPGHLRGRRLRRGRTPARRSVRRDARRHRGGLAGVDDVPSTQQCRRDRQLLLESPSPSRRSVMGSHGIADRVAIVGMGCTPFREHWEAGLDSMMIDASTDTFDSAGLGKDDIDAYWFGTAQSAMSGIPLAAALKLEGKPVEPRGELLCHRLGGAPPGLLRGRVRCL